MTGVEMLGCVVLVLLAYLVGAIPFGLVVGKLFYRVDVRRKGSGNVGTTNVFRVLGTRAGAAVFICDVFKGFLFTFIAAQFLGPWCTIIVGAATVIGHMYSIYLKGSGGKGVATGAGVVLALEPTTFIVCIALWLGLILVTRYVSVASLAAASLVPVLVIWHGDPLPYEIAAVLVALVIWWAHRGNIKRLLAGEENRANLFRGGKARPGEHGEGV